MARGAVAIPAFLFLLLLSPGPAGGQQPRPADAKRATPDQKKETSLPGWQKVKWGMSPDQVKRAYPGATCGGEGKPCRLDKAVFAGREVTVHFDFMSNRLAVVGLVFVYESSRGNDSAKDLERLRSLLIGKYGSPDILGNRRHHNTYEDEAKNLATPSSPDQYSPEFLWTRLNTGGIYLSLRPEGRVPAIVLVYGNKEHIAALSERYERKKVELGR
jgi:hypothetical protein